MIAVSSLHFTAVGHQSLIQFDTAGQPVRHTGSCLIKHEQFKLFTDLFMVALFGFFDKMNMLFQLIFGRISVEVDPLHTVIMLIASPISHGGRVDLEGCGK